MADKRWKQWEREVAKAIRGVRIPTSGSAQFPDEEGDVFHTHFEVECKHRAKILVASWFRTVVKRAAKTGKVPLLAIREKHMKRGALVVLRLEDFVRLTQKDNADGYGKSQ